MKSLTNIGLACAVIAALGLASNGALAQDADEQKEKLKEKLEKDKTGTNPVNFSRDLRIYNEFTELNTEGDGTQNVTTLEFRTPFADGAWQYRLRARYTSIKADLDGDGSDDIDESGLGDWDMRFLTVLSLDLKTQQAWATGLEVFLDTADEVALGSGATSLGPQIFWVQFFKGGLFAPGLQYKFSVDEDSGRDEVEQILIDLNYLKMADDKQSWFFTDPQIVIDNEADVEYAIVDLEWGWMMTNWNPDKKGQSFYVRPSFGVGADRPTEGSIEVGYKWVGW
jgi:hypothetical protein